VNGTKVVKCCHYGRVGELPLTFADLTCWFIHEKLANKSRALRKPNHCKLHDNMMWCTSKFSKWTSVYFNFSDANWCRQLKISYRYINSLRSDEAF
jgi:hypothetical protein